MKFNNVQITSDTFNKTKQYFIGLNESLIHGAKNGEFHVNDLEKYLTWKQDNIKYYNELTTSSNFTFLQRAYYIQTGECIALLPK